MPKISIITPMYNAEKYINNLFNSVISQTFGDFEWIIIDDCSKDNSLNKINSLINKYNENRIQLISNKKNSGVVFSRNIGIEKSSGKYIAFLDADDYWSNNKLELQYKFMEENNIKISYMDAYRFDQSGILNSTNLFNKADYNTLLKTNVINMSTPMLLTNIIGNIRFFKHGHEDYIFWLEILKKNHITAYKCQVEEPLIYWRVGNHSISSNKIKAAIWQFKIYRNIEKLSLFKSFYYMCHYTFNAIKKRM